MFEDVAPEGMTVEVLEGGVATLRPQLLGVCIWEYRKEPRE
jgi:hypothetical protein